MYRFDNNAPFLSGAQEVPMVGSRDERSSPPTGASRAQRPHAKTALRRESILKAAMSVFGARGYHNGSLQEIADQAGMTHAGVLHHFGSKEQLLIALLEYRDEADVVELEGHHAPVGAAFLRHLVRTAEENTARPGIVQAYTVLSGESVTEGHPAQEYFRERLAGLRAMLIAALDEATTSSASPRDVERVAAALVAIMDGLQIQWLLNPAAIDMPETVELGINAMVNYLKEPDPRTTV